MLPRHTAASNGESVRVVLRCRPISKQEAAAGCRSVVQAEETAGAVSLRTESPAGGELREFGFDSVFGPASTQSQVSGHGAEPYIVHMLHICVQISLDM